jgi:CubicO group peptidase (beta-lactamase class C family)
MRKWLIFTLIAAVLLVPFLAVHVAVAGNDPETETLSKSVDDIMEKYGFPAMGAAIITSDNIKQVTLGVRKVKTNNRVGDNDIFFIGSCGKAMTAMMIGILVDDGKLSWKTRPKDVFSDFAGKINPGYENITLEQLLTHHARIPSYHDTKTIGTIPHFDGDIKKQRRAFAEYVLSEPPAGKPGTYMYSNAGYVIAASMAEEATGESWENLMKKYLFNPLGITPLYGRPAMNDPKHQPWGHVKVFGILTAIPPNGPFLRIPDVLAPSGNISLTVHDWAVFVQMNLRGLRRLTTPFPQKIIDKIHKPSADFSFYAMGWGVFNNKSVRTHMHVGSDGTFYSLMAIYPQKDKAYVIVSNAVTDDATSANTDKAFHELLDKLAGN